MCQPNFPFASHVLISTMLIYCTLIGSAELIFEQTTHLHERILQDLHQNPLSSKEEVERVCKFYRHCQHLVSDALAARHQSYDLPTIYLATTALLMVIFCVVFIVVIPQLYHQIYFLTHFPDSSLAKFITTHLFNGSTSSILHKKQKE